MRMVTLGWRDLCLSSTFYSCAAEFIGTFLFVFLGCGSVISSGFLEDGKQDCARLLVISVAHGFAIAILVAATCGISGGHLNPAVTFGFVISGNMSLVKGAAYWFSQLVGGSLGAGYFREFPAVIKGSFGAHSVGSSFTTGEALGLEFFLTFALVYVVFGTAVDKKGPAQIAPLAIGMTIVVDHLVGVPITGASMNPARSLGAAIWSGQWSGHWIYWLGPLLGSSVAALLYTGIFLPSVDSAEEKFENRDHHSTAEKP